MHTVNSFASNDRNDPIIHWPAAWHNKSSLILAKKKEK